MAQSGILILGLLLLMSLAMVEATPPGIANNPSHATCKIKKYKHCYNLVHVCPKFCPDSCTVECASCKPICGPGSTPPPESESPSSPPPESESPTPSPSPPAPPLSPSSPPAPSIAPTPSPSSSPPPPTSSPPPSIAPTTPPTSSTPPPSITPTSPPKSSTPPPTSSPTPPSSPSPPHSIPESPPTSSRKRVKCLNKKYDTCYGQELVCPATCPHTCSVDCATCKPVCSCDYPGAVCQDPRFIGGDGITFYFHGKKDKDFCLVTDSNLHINGHFIGKRSPNMTRDFTWVQSLGILFNNHRLFIGAQKTATWDDTKDRLALTLDGEPIFLPQTQGFTWKSTTTPTVSVTRAGATNDAVINVEGNLKINAKVVPITEAESRIHDYGITNDDCFAHLDVGFKFYSLSGRVEGVLGQTYRDGYVSRAKMGIAMPVLGGDREYATSGIFATDCAVAKFQGIDNYDGKSSEGLELSSLSCASGMNGEGVVCKR